MGGGGAETEKGERMESRERKKGGSERRRGKRRKNVKERDGGLNGGRRDYFNLPISPASRPALFPPVIPRIAV